MNSHETIPLTVLSGFLGSGKTTLLRRWRHQEDLRDAAVVVHDLSDFGVDAELLSDESSRPQQGALVDRVAALHGRYAREELHPSAGVALSEIARLEPPPPHVLCESTGAARPWPLIVALTQDDRFHLRHFIVAVDALNLHRDHADGRVFTGEAPPSGDPALLRAAQVLSEQLVFASAIILTKTDCVPRPVVDDQVAVLRRLQPGATIALSTLGGVLLPAFDESREPRIAELRERAQQLGLTEQAPTADEVEAIVLRDPRPFHPQRLLEVVQSQLGTAIYRTKGFLWLASRPTEVLLWQQSGSQVAFEITGLWAAEAVNNRYGKLLPFEVESLKKELDGAHPVFGDRVNELTVIGIPAACEHFAGALRSALCTDEEVAAWARGEEFLDPWPKSVKKVG